jgi:hypothetical protein
MTRKDAKMISDTYLNHEKHKTNLSVDLYYSCPYSTIVFSSSSGNKMDRLEHHQLRLPIPFNSGIRIFIIKKLVLAT